VNGDEVGVVFFQVRYQDALVKLQSLPILTSCTNAEVTTPTHCIALLLCFRWRSTRICYCRFFL